MYRKNNERKSFNPKTLVVCFVLVALLYVGLLMLERAIITENVTTKVYVAIQNIEPDTLITENNIDLYFALVERSIASIPSDSISNRDDLINHTVNNFLSQNNPVTESLLTSRESEVSDIKDSVMVSFMVQSTPGAVSGTIRAGDRVNIWHAVNDEATQKTEVLPICKNVYIMTAYDSSGVAILQEDTSSIATMFNILIPSEVESAFHRTIEEGTLKLSKISEKELHQNLEVYDNNGKIIYCNNIDKENIGKEKKEKSSADSENKVQNSTENKDKIKSGAENKMENGKEDETKDERRTGTDD